jgi:hypothetical protein
MSQKYEPSDRLLTGQAWEEAKARTLRLTVQSAAIEGIFLTTAEIDDLQQIASREFPNRTIPIESQSSARSQVKRPAVLPEHSR